MKKILYPILLLLLIQHLSYAQTVTTIASGVGIDDDLILDQEGNLYGSNYGGSEVFKMTPEGIVTSFAGGFDTPNGLAFDADGVLYMADNVGNRIYKIYPDGTTEIFVDNFYNPSGLIFDLDSDSLIATSYLGDDNLSIIAPDGSYTGFSNSPDYNGPVGLCYDEVGDLYISNFTDRKILKRTADGEVSFFTQLPGSGALGFLIYNKGFFYATLFSTHKIYKIDLNGDAELYLGSSIGSVDGDASEARFHNPNGILPSFTGDSIYVSDYGTGSVRLITNLEGTVSATPSPEKNQMTMELLPNPVAVTSRLNLTLTEDKTISISLMDQYGRELRAIVDHQSLVAGNHQFSINASTLSPGNYYVVLISEDGQASMVRKIVVLK